METGKHSLACFVLEGLITNKNGTQEYWIVRALPTLGELVQAHKRFKDNPEWRIRWENNCPTYKIRAR